jgi:hypothetical protein
MPSNGVTHQTSHNGFEMSNEKRGGWVCLETVTPLNTNPTAPAMTGQNVTDSYSPVKKSNPKAHLAFASLFLLLEFFQFLGVNLLTGNKLCPIRFGNLRSIKEL